MQKQEADSAATPPPATTASPGPATTAQGVTEPATGDITPQGPIPFESHKKILENSRAEFTNYRQQYGWAEKIPQAKFEEFVGMAQRLSSDPVNFVSELLEQIDRHPVWGPHLRAATTSPTPQAAPPAKPAPDVQILDASGNVVGMTYSDAMLEKKLAAERADWERASDEKLRPVLNAEQERQHQAQVAESSRQLHAAADQRMGRMARMLEIPTGDLKHPLWQQVSSVWAAHPDWEPEDVALEVRATAIKPTQQAQAQAQAAEDMRKKAAGNTANGNSPTVTIQKPQNVKELADLMRQLEGAG